MGMLVQTMEATIYVLKIVAEHPGQLGRLRIARWYTGDDNLNPAINTDITPPHHDLSTADVTRLIDSMLETDLLTHTDTPRPKICITRAGWRALDTVESIACSY